MTRAWVLGLTCGLLGCADPSGPACEAGEPSLTIGRDGLEFEPLSTGDELTLVHGVQGGYHTDLALELRGLGESPTLELVGEVEGVRLADDFVAIDGVCVDDRVVVTDVRLVWAAEPDLLDGASAWIEVRATGSNGQMVSDQVTIVIVDSGP